MADKFLYDVFVNHSAKDKAVVRDMEERLRKNEVKLWFDESVLKPGDSIPTKIEVGLERSRALACPAGAWMRRDVIGVRYPSVSRSAEQSAPLSSPAFRRHAIKGFLAQFLYINDIFHLQTLEPKNRSFTIYEPFTF